MSTAGVRPPSFAPLLREGEGGGNTTHKVNKLTTADHLKIPAGGELTPNNIAILPYMKMKLLDLPRHKAIRVFRIIRAHSKLWHMYILRERRSWCMQSKMWRRIIYRIGIVR